MNDSASPLESPLMNESPLVNESAVINESASINESTLTGGGEPMNSSQRLPRLCMELNEGHSSDDKDWVITPKAGYLFS